jgi:Resolvase, N terminal domain
MARKGKLVEAVAYMRTRSAANAGADKDSGQRQRRAITGYAKRAGVVLVGEFNDPAVSGADPIQSRPGFAALLDRIEGNGVRTVIVEGASRFARELMTQELGLPAPHQAQRARGDRRRRRLDRHKRPVPGDDAPVAGGFAEYEKARLVAKLKPHATPRKPKPASVAAGSPLPNAARSWSPRQRQSRTAAAGYRSGKWPRSLPAKGT